MPLVAGAEHDHGLAPCGRDDVASVRRDASSLGQSAEVQRLEVRELRVVPFDVHHRLVRLRDLAVVQRRHPELGPRRFPHRGELPRDLEDLTRHRLVGRPVDRGEQRPRCVEPPFRTEVTVEERVGAGAVPIVTGADVQDREGLVRTDDDRVGVFLEDLHGDPVVPVVSFEDELRTREVDVALVAGPDLLDRKAEHVGPQALGDDHRPRTCS